MKSDAILPAILTTLALSAAAGLPLAGLSGCDSSDKSVSADEGMSREESARATISKFMAQDPGLQKFFDSAAGWAVFPPIGKGGLLVGAAHGSGVVFNKAGAAIGYSSMTAGSIGAQIGGQSFSEIIFFKEQADLDTFKRGEFEFDANASAVAIKSGAAAAADYSKGVAIFVTDLKGLMAEASVGGQKFTYTPKN